MTAQLFFYLIVFNTDVLCTDFVLPNKIVGMAKTFSFIMPKPRGEAHHIKNEFRNITKQINHNANHSEMGSIKLPK